MGWYTNDKFTEAQREAIVGKCLVGGTIGKADISDRWPTVTLQLANVGPTIVCYMGISGIKGDTTEIVPDPACPLLINARQNYVYHVPCLEEKFSVIYF